MTVRVAVKTVTVWPRAARAAQPSATARSNPPCPCSGDIARLATAIFTAAAPRITRCIQCLHRRGNVRHAELPLARRPRGLSHPGAERVIIGEAGEAVGEGGGIIAGHEETRNAILHCVRRAPRGGGDDRATDAHRFEVRAAQWFIPAVRGDERDRTRHQRQHIRIWHDAQQAQARAGGVGGA